MRGVCGHMGRGGVTIHRADTSKIKNKKISMAWGRSHKVGVWQFLWLHGGNSVVGGWWGGLV